MGTIRSKPVAWGVWAVLTALLAAGCTTMPDSGDPERIAPPPGAGGDNGVQVRVIPVPPRDGQTPREVLQNFLDASIADERGYNTAQQYLTPNAVKTWRPDDGVVILRNTTPGPTATESDSASTQISIHSPEVGQLDAKHTYSAVEDDSYEAAFTLVNVAKDARDASRAQWRIDDLPGGLIVNQTNFANTYQQVDRYFYTAPDPTQPVTQQPVLVPDPIYLRRRVDPASAAATAVAMGPSDWLGPAVHSAFGDAKIVGSVGGDDPRTPRVQVDGTAVNGAGCQLIAAQLYFTLSSQAGGSGSLDSVTLTNRHNSTLCTLTSAQAKVLPSAPGALAGTIGASTPAYYRNEVSGSLYRMSGQDNSAPVPGALGAATQPAGLAPTADHLMGPFAVSRDNKQAAVVSDDAKDLYLAGLANGEKLGPPVAVSHAPNPQQGFTSPSWDGYGGLWVVDRDPAAPEVLLIRGPVHTVVNVDLPAGHTVDGIKLSSDGTRAALLLKDGSGATSLALGLVLRSGTPDAPVVQIGSLRLLAPQLDVTSVSWADTDLLLVLGKETDSVPQLHYVQTDGSQIADSPLQAVDGMTVVAASESRTDSVLADSADPEHAIYGQGGNAAWQWRAYAKHGALPGYPG
ncbi:Flp pilus assembly protein TadG [Kitasatospora sp. MAP12-15]|uniref:LpqB family beta-propeller domain-containing protein n=1 Tax=unclassified Kitasatospora TaxID=2633591 RepID=UPI002473F038|nr:LpqB family beta-propeller domain-containing protein [Kitasatospora sp. MAP12-44]MDH6110780.1 Flp pilus assembly protein TadG [Kitasatospora sp. MAP12-44]